MGKFKFINLDLRRENIMVLKEKKVENEVV